MAVCSNGHQSTDDDFCSVCGVPIAGAAPAGPGAATATPAAPAAAASGGELCPSCGTPRDGDVRFCEVCRWDFVEKAPGPLPLGEAVAAPSDDSAASATGAPASSDPSSPEPVPSVALPSVATPPQVVPTPSAPVPGARVSVAQGRWEIVVRADASLDTEPDPDNPCPTDLGELYFPLDLEDNLVGRQDLSRNIAPEIPLQDKAVSHRQASIHLAPDGSLTITDLNSTNGTQLNGTELMPGAASSLNAGDVLVVGQWSSLTVQARP